MYNCISCLGLNYFNSDTLVFRANLVYATPGLPFVPAIAIIVNIYLILNLSILTLIRFTIWMIFGNSYFVN